MDSPIYQQLASFLDDLPAGFPRSESGVELRLLEHLFTPEEATLAMQLALIAEEAPVIALRAGIPLADAQRILAELERKRLIYVFNSMDGKKTYMAEQFVVGFWEGQVNRLDTELVELFEEYLPIYARSGIWEKAPQLRTIPVRESIPVKHTILSYEHIDQILAGHNRFAVANCICRQEQRLVGHDCQKPLETCLAFDSSADYFVSDGRGRYITRDEALTLTRRAEETGLVLQAGNIRTTGNICMCCGCCCGVLRSLKLNPSPARAVSSPFIVALDEFACIGCGDCEERCQMDALSLPFGTAVLDRERCIGCGLCVTNCPGGALTLTRKPDSEQRPIPRTIVHLAISMAQSRGKLGPLKLASLATRSGIDRVRAALK